MAKYVWLTLDLKWDWTWLLLIQFRHKVTNLLQVWRSRLPVGESKLNDSPATNGEINNHCDWILHIWGSFQLYEKKKTTVFGWDNKWNDLSNGHFSKNLEYLQSYSSFLVFTEMIAKSLYHLLFHSIPPCSLMKYAVVSVGNDWEQSFPLEGFQILSNITHSSGLILPIEILYCSIWRKILTGFPCK